MIYMITLEKKFVQAVKNGEKTIEVRTRIPKKLASGDTILIAQKNSNGRVVLACRVSQILELDPKTLFRNYGQLLYCSHEYYTLYTSGHDNVFAIGLTDIFEFPNHITTHSFLVARAPQWFTIVPNPLFEYVLQST